MKQYHGRLPCVFLALAMMTAGTGSNAQVPAMDTTGELSGEAAWQTRVFECTDGFNFVTRLGAEQAWLFLPGDSLSLSHVRSASGAKYSDGTTTFWSKGDEAMLYFDGQTRSGCRNNRARAIWEEAKLNGVEFRAVGNEPGWFLEITPAEQIVFVSSYGETRYVFPTPDPLVDQQAHLTSYETRNKRHELTIVLKGQACRDTMSGEWFETTVTVRLDDKLYRGCGKALH
jgi:membrane-bound inhibitor of C-type lysozyme/uncharacterized membrane protein